MSAQPFSANLRSEILTECERGPLDIAIIGGGITGAGCLRDAAMRGLRVALFEKNDFGSGTSSASSKLIHGGLRYLETAEFKLVFEANRERHTLLNIAPTLVRPLPFLFPVYRRHRRGLPAITAGVFLYYLLALPRNIGKPHFYFKEQTLKLEPNLRLLGLRGCATYYDAITDDVALTLANVKSGWSEGGLAVNHAEVTDLIEENKRTVGLRVKDQISGKSHNIRARWVVNASGPWSDFVRKKYQPLAAAGLRLTKGVHILVDRERMPVQHAVVMLAPSDGRVTFVIPWDDLTLIGTTDTDFSGNPDDVKTELSDVEYLLDTTNYYFPQMHLKKEEIVSTFAGLRPLLRNDKGHPSSVSREHRIISEHDGWVTIAGGKLTSFREMAEELVDWMIARTPEWKAKTRPCRTAVMSLSDSGTYSFSRSMDEEMAATVEDLLARRKRLLLLERGHGINSVPEVSKLLQDRLGYSPQQIAEQIQAYEETARKASVT